MAEVSLDGLQVTLVEGTSRRPMGGAVRDARERAAGALASAGATVRMVNLAGWRDALLPYLLMLQEDPDSDSASYAGPAETRAESRHSLRANSCSAEPGTRFLRDLPLVLKPGQGHLHGK